MPKLITTKNELIAILPNSSLPNRRTGLLFISCESLNADNNVSFLCLYQTNLEWFQCECRNLTPGTLYKVQLEHRYSGFQTRIFQIENSYTSILLLYILI